MREGFGTGAPSPTGGREDGRIREGFGTGDPSPTASLEGDADAGGFWVTRQKTRPLREDGKMTGGMYFGWFMILKNPFGRIMIDI